MKINLQSSRIYSGINMQIRSNNATPNFKGSKQESADEYFKRAQEELKANTLKMSKLQAELEYVIKLNSFLPDGYYSDKEIAYAKKYLGVEDWEEKLRVEHMNTLSNKMGFFKYCFTSAPEKETAALIRRVKDYMIGLNNQRIFILQENELKAQLKQEALERQIKLKELEKRKKRNEEQINSKITERLSNGFINPLKDNSEQVPSTIMLESTKADKRKEITQWLKDEVDAKIISFKLPDNEDDALYRLNTELEYAQENYEKTGKRTVLFIDNFSRILDASKVSNETIAEMKAILYSLSEDKEPLTIVFDVSSSNNIDGAFLGNKRRIPLKLNLDDLMLGQKRDWELGLDENIKSMENWRLEVHKCRLSQNVENAIREKDYRKVIELKETIALICEMQGKERDAHLLRVDIDNYLKRI